MSEEVKKVEKKSNGIGLAGFILSIIALFLGWVPFLGWILWAVGVILSFIGVFKQPRGLSIAGLIISFISIIFLVFVFAALGLSAATM